MVKITDNADSRHRKKTKELDQTCAEKRITAQNNNGGKEIYQLKRHKADQEYATGMDVKDRCADIKTPCRTQRKDMAQRGIEAVEC